MELFSFQLLVTSYCVFILIVEELTPPSWY